jgi:hypothetical protein
VIPDFDTIAVARRGIAYGFSLGEFASRSDFFAVEYNGFLQAAGNGEYTFTLGSDDGSRLLIDGKPVVDNDGLHAYREEKGTVTLGTGKHDLTVRYFQSGGAKRLEVRYAGPGVPEQTIPPGKLFIAK